MVFTKRTSRQEENTTLQSSNGGNNVSETIDKYGDRSWSGPDIGSNSGSEK
jgi:hypothetical protein